ncbi:MAG: trigger factor [Clostridia bacterium]|nr:trigger factor [Clostridia bacterium]
MNDLQVEKLPHSMAKLTVTVSADGFEAAMEEVYAKNRDTYDVPGFPKGEVPMDTLEKMYGPEMFYQEAAGLLVNLAYPEAERQCGLTIVSTPEIEVVQMEKGKDFIFTETFAVKPEVILGAYRGIEIAVEAATVTDEAVLAELEAAQKQNARTVDAGDRPVQVGDIVNMDYSGSIDGVVFEGGTAQGQTLEIGSRMFIPGFEEQMVGHRVGESFDVSVTFPEQYHAPELAGKPAVFAVTVHGIQEKRLMPLDDDFAKAAGFPTLAELKAAVRAALEQRAEQQARADREDAVLEAIIAGAQMDIADAMIQTQAERMYQELAERMRAQGLEMEEYFRYTGTTREALVEQHLPKAEQMLRQRLVLEAVAQAEGITVTEEEFEAQVKSQSQAYGMNEEHFRSLLTDAGLEAMRQDLTVQKALDFVVEAASIG